MVDSRMLAAYSTGSQDGADAPKPSSPGSRSDQFVAVTGPESEQVSASGMVVAAYGLFWLAILALVALTYRRQTQLVARVNELEKRLAKDEKSP